MFLRHDGEGMKLSLSRMQSVQVSLAEMLSGESWSPLQRGRSPPYKPKENFLMKKVEAIIRPHLLDAVRTALQESRWWE